MRGGQLDRRITIQRQQPVDDPIYGPQPPGPNDPWLNFSPPRIPAQVQDDLPSKNERIDGAVQVQERPARVRIRYMRGITPDMRIVLHEETDTIFQIVGGPAEIGRREWTEFTVKAFKP